MISPHGRADGSIVEDSATIRVPVREEQVSVEKRTVVTDEIDVGKLQLQDTEHVLNGATGGSARRSQRRRRDQRTALRSPRLPTGKDSDAPLEGHADDEPQPGSPGNLVRKALESTRAASAIHVDVYRFSSGEQPHPESAHSEHAAEERR